MFADGSKVPYERTRRLIENSRLRSRRRRCGSRSSATPRRLRADAKRLRGVRSFGGSCQCGPPDSRAGRTAAGPYLCSLGKSRHPAAVSRRSLAIGEPSRHHYADAGRSGVAARHEAVICRARYYHASPPRVASLAKRRVDRRRTEASISCPDISTGGAFSRHHGCQRHLQVQSGMPQWQEHLFIALSQSAVEPPIFPDPRVVEVGTQGI